MNGGVFVDNRPAKQLIKGRGPAAGQWEESNNYIPRWPAWRREHNILRGGSDASSSSRCS